MNEVDIIALLEHLRLSFTAMSREIAKADINEPDPKKAEEIKLLLKGQSIGIFTAACIINLEKEQLEEKIGHDLDAIEKEIRDA